MRGENVPINGPMLLEKTHSLAIDKGVKRFCQIYFCIEGFIYVKACILFVYRIYHL